MQNQPSGTTEVEAWQVLAAIDRMVLMKAGASFSSLPEHLKSSRPDTAAEEDNTYTAKNNLTLPSSDEARHHLVQVYEDTTFNFAKPLHLGLFFDAAMSLQKDKIPSLSMLAWSVWAKLDSDAKKRVRDDIGKEGGPDKLAIAKEIFPAMKSRFEDKLAANTINVTAAVKVPEVVQYIIANKDSFLKK
ncbi:hypothetical protein CNMCM5793_005208 [Aspergillus hiratsukae]|uniref:Uncharacterized protein n=1 Tax=Aspergillus hiratsukae TaxID=1194566 RepID=A0A8H6PFQ4_9EURO|nr:hypothetical protein CNMCM5793_005208 [Aspergillus hiratsukae]KAF7173029.1 hypothetical protein CNMCM6106_007172 [Aspergillus hiratsukae]